MSDRIGCFSARCLEEFDTFEAMARHRWAAHRVPIAYTYEGMGEPPPPEETPPCATSAATPPTTARPGAPPIRTTTRTMRDPVWGTPLVLTEDGALPCLCAMGGGARHCHRVTLDDLVRMTAPQTVWRPVP